MVVRSGGCGGRRAGVLGAVLVAFTLVSCAAPPPPLPAGAVPILFVHGHGGDAGVFDDMVEHLERAGYPPAYLMPVDLLPADGANEDAARETIAPAVEELVARTGGGPDTRVDIVAHSMGAVSSRWYASRLRPERVRTLLAVAGANHGTDVLCGLADPGGRELCPAFATGPNTVQVALNGTPAAPVDETPFGRSADPPGVLGIPADGRRTIRWVAVLIPGDEWIVPVTSSELAGADPVAQLPAGVAVEQVRPGNLVFAEPTGHDVILGDQRFFEVLDAVLAGSSR